MPKKKICKIRMMTELSENNTSTCIGRHLLEPHIDSFSLNQRRNVTLKNVKPETVLIYDAYLEK